MSRKKHTAAADLLITAIIAVCTLRPVRAAAPVPVAPTGSRFSVAAQVLPGNVSMTVLYVTDNDANKLYIYRSYGQMDTSFDNDPKLYRTYDLTSAGKTNLQLAK